MLYVDQHFKDALSEYLNKDERLIWAGTPKTGIIFSTIDFFLIPFGIIWCAFVGFWMYMAVQASLLFALFGIPFVLVGIYLLVGRFIFENKVRSNTIYGLTTNRIIIRTGARQTTTSSFQLDGRQAIFLTEFADGTGTIVFGNRFDALKRMQEIKSLSSTVPSSSRLFRIRDAKKVYSEIMKTQSELNRAKNDQ